uniref:Uncharacterized protein n=1 Tax=Picea glauca TaxID=3330 RepID=A0A101M265_PICGL|nr:hypothetical protein ABT39_MTgene2926 [Picea glauca]
MRSFSVPVLTRLHKYIMDRNEHGLHEKWFVLCWIGMSILRTRSRSKILRCIVSVVGTMGPRRTWHEHLFSFFWFHVSMQYHMYIAVPYCVGL